MRVAVTGGTGFVGSHLIEALLARGDDVVGLARSLASARRLEALGLRAVIGSLADASALAQLVDGVAVVYHVAGAVGARDPAEFLRLNQDGTARLVAAVHGSGVSRLLYVSSLAASGPTVPGKPLDDAVSPAPVTAYGRSKLAGEQTVRAAGLPFTIVRPPTVYGPRERELLRVFRLCRFGVAPLLGGGGQELSLIHAADLARALIAAATHPAAENRVYHAAHPERVTQRGLVEAVGRAVGRRVRTVRIPASVVRAILQVTGTVARIAGRTTLLSPQKTPEFLAPAWTCSSEALTRDTGWRAEIGLDDGLAQTARWYRDNGWL